MSQTPLPLAPMSSLYFQFHHPCKFCPARCCCNKFCNMVGFVSICGLLKISGCAITIACRAAKSAADNPNPSPAVIDSVTGGGVCRDGEYDVDGTAGEIRLAATSS